MNNNPNEIAIFFNLLTIFYFFCLVCTEEDYLRDSILELEMRNELLLEKLNDMEILLSQLDKKYRKFMAKHTDCKKRFILYR
jgi:hypothetical protein